MGWFSLIISQIFAQNPIKVSIWPSLPLFCGLIEWKKRDFLEKGGIKEEMYQARKDWQKKNGAYGKIPYEGNGGNGRYGGNGVNGSNGVNGQKPDQPNQPNNPNKPTQPNK